MEYLRGFKWPIPVAFLESVAKARFEEGDVFYSDRCAYEEAWGVAVNDCQTMIQVRFPSRAEVVAKAAGKDIINRNWNSEVRVDIYSGIGLRNVESSVKATQGRLFATLWTGSIELLRLPEALSAPQVPHGVQFALRHLHADALAEKCRNPSQKTFVMVRDIANPVSREKFSKVYRKLKSQLLSEPVFLSPEEAGLSQSMMIMPTIEIVLFRTKLSAGAEVENEIKAAVYVPSKGATKDMFRISSHGLIV